MSCSTRCKVPDVGCCGATPPLSPDSRTWMGMRMDMALRTSTPVALSPCTETYSSPASSICSQGTSMGSVV